MDLKCAGRFVVRVCVSGGMTAKQIRQVVFASMPEQTFSRLVETGLCVFMRKCTSVCVCVWAVVYVILPTCDCSCK